MSYHPIMQEGELGPDGVATEEKTLEVGDASRLARLAYRVVLQQRVDHAKVLRKLKSGTAKEVGKAVLGATNVDSDARDMAERLKKWASKNAGIPIPDGR
jgi:hypothetical protein